ncbi:hypothetical protein ACFQ14_16700 [Pseudahrensia aquimaris]|uniref:Uncharacterized protein n=1 Tax=Pseudahrensia aquimaris TaxID=744461 RepID=A0ABW3FMF3_9HYPH
MSDKGALVSADALEYIEEMLTQLRSLSEEQNQHFLSYLIEMAMVEAGTLHKISAGEILTNEGSASPEELARAYMDGTL